MKVAIIAFNNICFSPYIDTYVKILESVQIEYHLIYPNRKNIDEEFDGHKVALPWNEKRSKAINFLSFSKKTKGILKKEKYDFVFVLTTFPAVLLSTFLLKHYNGKYLVDVRDYTYEHNKIFFHLEEKAMKNAAMVAISAPGFINFLPTGNMVLSHNIPSRYKNSPRKFRKAEKHIIIGYVGSISYVPYCRKLIDLVKNDERFSFHFYGNEENNETPIRHYVEQLKNERILYFGSYTNEEKGAIIEKVDILFNVYGNDKMLVKYALSNKLYDSFYFKKPLLVSPNTAMQEESSILGCAIDLDDYKSLDFLYNWYHNIQAKECEQYADAYIEKALRDNEILKQKILALLQKD